MNQRQKQEQQEQVVSARRRLDEHQSGGVGGKTIKAPPGTVWFSIKNKGSYEVDILPYKVGKGNPYCDEGLKHYERTYWSHRSVGVNNERVICTAKTFGEPCYVCEFRAEAGKDPDNKAIVEALFPSERQLWNVVPRFGEHAGKVCLWDVSNYLFGEHLDERLKRDKEDRYIYFADPKKGWTLVLGASEQKIGKKGGTCIHVYVDEFQKRPGPISESLLEAVLCLDDLLIRPKYAEVKRMMHVSSPDEDEGNGNGHEDEERSSRSKGRVEEEPPKDEDVTEPDDEGEEEAPVKLKVGDLVMYRGQECEVKKMSKDGSFLTLENEEGETHKNASPEKCKKLERTKQEEKPPPAKPGKNGAPGQEDDDEDDEEWEAGEEEEEKAPPVKKGKKTAK